VSSAFQSVLVAGQQIAFTPDQQHYLLRVLRLRSGDRFLAIFPGGSTWLAQIQPALCSDAESDDRDRYGFELIEPQAINNELPMEITLVLSLPKGSGFDDVVRQVTELGVTRIVPVVSDRTVLKPSANRHDRWQRIALEATEQSERSRPPQVEAPIPFSQYLKQFSAPPAPGLQVNSPLEGSGFEGSGAFEGSGSIDLAYLCWGRGEARHLMEQLQQDLRSSSRSTAQVFQAQPRITIAIGPEGGWTNGEVDRAKQAGFVPVSLGKRILRAITAPAAAMAIVAALIESQLESQLAS
jgi:16S rRNA (uracil1498-N3)-methyltransferase